MSQYLIFAKLNEKALIQKGWLILVIFGAIPYFPQVHINWKKNVVNEEWGQIITLQPTVVTWITSLFRSLEVRQSNSFWTKESLKRLGTMMAWVQSPWVHQTAILLWGPATTQGTDRLLSSSKSDRISSLLCCSCLSLSEALASHSQSTFPILKELRSRIQTSSAFGPHNKTPRRHGNTRGLTTFWNKWKG